ncbi:RUN and FYVE domain-containing protein 4 [Rhynchocyon petersi]
MAEEGAGLKVTRDLKAAVSAIVQHYGDGQQSVTDTSAELHRLCGCLELLLQFDQKEQKSFLRPRKDYWDFLWTALRQQREDSEPARFVCTQDKLKTPLGKGRAFIRFCLARGQLAECLQLCLLNPELTREWYGPQSPLVSPELQEDILDSLYALNGVVFNLDLQRADLDGAWPMFSDGVMDLGASLQISATCGGPKGVHQEEPQAVQASCLGDAPIEDTLEGLPGSQPHWNLPTLEKMSEDIRSQRSPHRIQEPEEEKLEQGPSEAAPRPGICLQNSTLSIRGPEKGNKGTLKKVIGTGAEGRAVLPGTKAQRSVEASHEGEAQWGHVQRLLVSNPAQTTEEATPDSQQELEVPKIQGDPWVLHCLGKGGEGIAVEKPREQTGVISVNRREEQAAAQAPGQELVKSLRCQLQEAREQIQHQDQRLREKEGELKTLQKHLCSCHEERAQLQAELERRHQEAERKDAIHQEELQGQRDLVQAMKRRMLELIQEKDDLWQKVQHLSSVSPASCVNCSKTFGRLSRRYPCRLCGGLVCHACSTDYKKRECCCPPCAQRGNANVT